MNTDTPVSALDLTQRPPRSPRVRLGCYAMLPRVLDKARASLIEKAGDYKYGNPMDQHFFEFTLTFNIGEGTLVSCGWLDRIPSPSPTTVAIGS